MRRAGWWLVLSLLVSLMWSSAAQAHELESNTARITLRDGNVTIHVLADARSWFSAEQLVAGVRLRLDGRDVPLKLRQFPNPAQLAEAAAAAAIESDLGGHAHSRLLPIEFESVSSGWQGSSLEVQFPEELGPVLVSFVQPKTQQLDPGAPARFDVLKKVPAAATQEAGAGMGWLLGMLVMASGLGAAWHHRGSLGKRALPSLHPQT